METVHLLQPYRNILVHPPQNCYHFLMNLLYSVYIPTNGLVMEYTITECPKSVQRG